jgi:hypothetical protein
MELLKRANEAELNLQQILETSTDFTEITQLDELRQLLIGLSSGTAKISKKSNSLKENNVPLTGLPEIAVIKESTKNLSEKFIETPKSTSIFESKKWANFYEKITSIINNSDKSVESDWTKYFNTLFGGMTPEQRRSRLILKIPANKIAMEKYTKLYSEFIQYKNQIPDNKEVFLKIHNLVKQLSEVSLSFDDDAPENVKKFFEQTNYGASLEYLTEDVMTWLRDKDLLSSYVVRAKGQ